MIICWANLLTIIYIAKLFLNFVAFYFQFLWYFIFNYCDKTLLLLYQLQEVDTKIFINKKSPTSISGFNFIHKYLNNIKICADTCIRGYYYSAVVANGDGVVYVLAANSLSNI